MSEAESASSNMCRPSHPFCQKLATSESLSNALPYNLLPPTLIDHPQQPTMFTTPPHSSRVLFIPKHNNAVTHLPIYDIAETYYRAVKDASVGSHLYMINLMFMARPKGDGTDAEVWLLVDVHGDTRQVTVEERSLDSDGQRVATITLPTTERDPCILRRAAHKDSHVRVQSTPFPRTKCRQYPTLTMTTAAGDGEVEWQIQPIGKGSLCYHVVKRVSDAAGRGAASQLVAIYHNAGPHLEHPVDCSEGVLLVPGIWDASADIVVVSLIFILLRHIRDLGSKGEKSVLTNALRRLSLKS